MIGPPSRKDPAGYRTRTFEHSMSADRDGALFWESLDEDDTAVVVLDVIAETTVSGNIVDQVRETLSDEPLCLKSPLQLLEMLNRRLCNASWRSFASLLVVVLDAKRHRLTVANPGEYPVLKRTNQGICALTVAGCRLGSIMKRNGSVSTTA